MSLRARKIIADKIYEITKSSCSTTSKNGITIDSISSLLELRKSNDNEKCPELHLPAIKARNLLWKGCENGKEGKDGEETLIKQIIESKYKDEIIKNVVGKEDARTRSPNIIFQLNTNMFMEEIVREYRENWKSNSQEENSSNLKEKIIVEFSSPNIAKPFHVGHLRSTIIGNFISNLYQYLGHEVTRLNYLGDWGTQFGLLQVGLEAMQLTDEQIRLNPIQWLLIAYVTGNNIAAIDSSAAQRAREIFTKLETGQAAEIENQWKTFRKYTIEELEDVYNRLGIRFDEYAWESQYGQQEMQNVIKLLENKKLLYHEADGRKSIEVGERRVSLIKSDGSTLYLARDIAALLDRFERYKFNKIIYVVDNSQTDHFNACFHVVKQIEEQLENRMKHIKFGRIHGMSTRAGRIIFLNGILDEAKDLMLQKQIESPTTKIDLQGRPDDTCADILGVSAVIVNDLKQRRQRDYEFQWDKALQVNGDTGIKLQYTHCRLCSLFESIPIQPADNLNSQLLQETEAKDLLIEIARFPEIILKAEENLEACVLVNYLFSLSNATSRALKKLNVKNEPSTEKKSQRLLLFKLSKEVLGLGMKILGLRLLEKM